MLPRAGARAARLGSAPFEDTERSRRRVRCCFFLDAAAAPDPSVADSASVAEAGRLMGGARAALAEDFSERPLSGGGSADRLRSAKRARLLAG